MKKRLLLLISFIPLCFTTSCDGNSIDLKFPDIANSIVETKLYVGSYPKVQTEEGLDLDNILYLDFCEQNENISDSLSYDYKINLSESNLISFSNVSKEDIKFYDLTNEIRDYLKDDYNNISNYFDEGNKIDIFFEYGEESEFFTSRVSIKESGLYFFGTVNSNGAIPSYSHSLIYSNGLNFINL